jgi:tetratricopeptide (TPR) repeat protein
MATFKALNVESDHEEDIEIDDTKEIQIEEALKLYQTALKFHSDGPPSYTQAAEAYRALFESDIFKYPESQQEINRLELYGAPPETDDYYSHHQEHIVPTGESAPSTLPQIIHLAYKNHGQFLLESLQHELLHSTQDVQLNTKHILKASAAALECFVEAIDKDDSDLDLWRRSAAVGEMLGSHRIARFCLEAVLDDDAQGLDSVLSIPGISETLAGQQLRELVAKLHDELSVLQAPLSTMKRRQLSSMLKQKLANYSIIHNYQTKHPSLPVSTNSALRCVLSAPRSWHDLGDILLRHYLAEQAGTTSALPGLGVSFTSDRQSPDVEVIEPDQPSPRQASVQSPEVSSLVDAQFPGTDGGQPTILPPSSNDAEVTEETPQAPSVTVLPTRKRSSDAAGLIDANSAEGARSKSKRLRARESIIDQSQLEDETMVDPAQADDALADLDYVDNQLFESLDELFEKVRLPKFAVPPNARKDLREATTGQDMELEGVALACVDMFSFLSDYSDERARVLLNANSDLDTTSDAHVKPSGRFSAAPSNQSRSVDKPDLDLQAELDRFTSRTNSDFLHINDVLYEWVVQFLHPGHGLLIRPELSDSMSSYVGHTWPQDFKALLVRVLVTTDTFIFETLSEFVLKWDKVLLTDTKVEQLDEALAFVEVIQTLFELHVDVYSLVKEPNSGVDPDTLQFQEDRAERWGNLARDAMNLRTSLLQRPSLKDQLNLRYLWTVTHHISVSNNISQEQVIACWSELRSIFEAVGGTVIDLPNNSVMPQMSIEAIDRELSRLTTQDFFTRVFDPTQNDPTVVIEGLEPLLETLHRDVHSATSCVSAEDVEPTHSASTPAELLNFLKNSNIGMQVSLWQRLREAYETIDYQPMVVCCYFRVIELLLSDLKSVSYSEKSANERQTVLLKYMRLIKDLVGKISASITSHTDALDCMDDERLQSATGCLVDLQKVLHASTMLQDEIKVGARQTPSSGRGTPLKSFTAVTKVLRELQLVSWTLLYKFYRESLAQNKQTVEKPNESLFEFLRAVHQVLGARDMCGGSERVFLKLAKMEVLRFRNESEEQNDDFDLEFAQILYDMFGLRCFLNPSYALREHNCIHDAFVDKTSGMQAVDLLLNLASRIKMTDLPKHPLRETIEKVHGIIGRKKPSDAILRNRDVYRAFLKSIINPVDLYKCLRGEGELALTPVPAEHAILAAKGWYFLMGHISLSKFRAQKRIGPTATEDLNIAVAFFMQALEFSMDDWELWFRLAQAYDSKIEEAVSWTAEKLNGDMTELVAWQRAAIHCYTMAVALAMRSADPSADTQAKFGEMFADFAMRIYSSSREPFGMKAFAIDDAERFQSRATITKVPPFKALSPFSAFKVARELFRRAIRINPNKWKLHYYLGKCLWKMYCNATKDADRPSIDAIINEFCESINLLPRKKDSKREPILEPHYKLVSVVNKMVNRRFLDAAEGCSILTATPFAAKVEQVSEIDSWEPYILKVLRSLRAADKVHWHHRMIYRTAAILYRDGSKESYCLAAKHELMQQMFTKTMMMNVWKPENERPGRHFVYTTRYADMFIKILEFLEDRLLLDALARRVRKKTGEFFEHGDLWQFLCTAYLKVLRRHGQIPIAQETAIFSGINHDDFLKRKDYLEKWCQEPANASHPVLETMQEVIELKKINGGLMKAATIDDLIGDAYAYLYDTVGRRLWTLEEAKDEVIREEALAKEQAATPSVERNPMMNLSHLMNVDGAPDAPVKMPGLPTVASVPDGTATPPTGDQAPASRRKIGVGRREVRLCADACIAKIGVGPTTLAGNDPPRPRQEVSVVIETRRPSSKLANQQGIESAEGSVSGSIHDSADDESDSELSDIDEDVVNSGITTNGHPSAKPPMFPNLPPRFSSVKHSDLVTDTEEEHDDGVGGVGEAEDYDGEGDGQEEIDDEEAEDEDGEEGEPEADDTAQFEGAEHEGEEDEEGEDVDMEDEDEEQDSIPVTLASPAALG